MKKVLIADDEEDARTLLRQYISERPELSIVGEASNGLEAVEMINRLKPDTVFLDIEMPGLNGFEVLTELEELPQVIFSTAYDQYAIKAFEVNAIDYLLKPYDKLRFEKTLGRINSHPDPLIPLTERLLGSKSEFPSRIILHKGSRKILVNTSDLIYAEAYGDYTKIYTAKEFYIALKGITTVLEQLDPKTFFRIHRSYFVNRFALQEIVKEDRYYFTILSTGQRIKISDSYMPEIRKIII